MLHGDVLAGGDDGRGAPARASRDAPGPDQTGHRVTWDAGKDTVKNAVSCRISCLLTQSACHDETVICLLR